LTACAEPWIAFSSPAHAAVPAVLALLGVTLALIGPGEWSLDARIYGRKHIVHPRVYQHADSRETLDARRAGRNFGTCRRQLPNPVALGPSAAGKPFWKNQHGQTVGQRVHLNPLVVALALLEIAGARPGSSRQSR
jgi:hypothetical protein